MKVKVEKLHKALKSVRPALADKAIVESFVRFFFSGSHIITYNGRILISHPFDTGDISFSILAGPFFSFVSKTKVKEIDISLKGGNVKIKGKGLSGKIAIESDPEMPEIEIPDIDDDGWRSLPEGFSQGLKMCLLSMETDPSSPLSNVQFNESGEIVTSDDVRVSCYDTGDEFEERFYIPGSSAGELVNFENESLSQYLLQENLIFFASDKGAIFCSTRSADDWEEDLLQHMDLRGSKYKLPKTIKTAIESSMAIDDTVEDHDKMIEVKIEDGSISCKSEGSSGYIETKQKLKLGKNNIQFSINPIYFTHILELSTLMTISDDIALFKSGKFRHLVALKEEVDAETT